jgi:hypothetical protein
VAADLGAGGKHEPALPPGVGMQQQWQPRVAEHGQQALQPTVVVGVAVRQHYRPQVGGRHIEHGQVTRRTVLADPSVIEHARPTVDGDQSGVAVLSAKRGPVEGIGEQRWPPHHLGAGQQDFNGIVQQHGNFDRCHRAQ